MTKDFYGSEMRELNSNELSFVAGGDKAKAAKAPPPPKQEVCTVIIYTDGTSKESCVPLPAQQAQK